jgi:hypothetical protein
VIVFEQGVVMKTRIGFALIAVTLIIPCLALTAFADVAGSQDKYYYIGPRLTAAQYDPTSSDTSATTWNGNGFLPGSPPQGSRVGPDSVLVLARRNIEAIKKKTIRVYVKYLGDTLKVDSIGHGSKYNVTVPPVRLRESDGPDPTDPPFRVLDVVANIVYQPSWEWAEISNPLHHAIQVHSATIGPVCTTIPAMTPYGALILTLMLAGTAVWLIRRRRRLQARA